MNPWELTERYKEGDELGSGLTVTYTKGYFEMVYKCAECGRMQTATCQLPIRQTGLGEEGAEMIGWCKTAEGWTCPFCCGKTKQFLEAMFGGDAPPNFAEYGRRKPA